MRLPRIYHPKVLKENTEILLYEEASHHISKVLRMHCGDQIILFNGNNHVFYGQISVINKKHVYVQTTTSQLINNESPLEIHLGQVISRGEKMDFTIQKSVELGVNIITPLFSTRCGVKLEGERLEKKIQQWQKIIISACEQCGRNTIPLIRSAQQLETWCKEDDGSLKINLHPQAKYSINTLPNQLKRVRLLIGPEGGLSDEEINLATDCQFADILLGPRILRTETAALTAITALQVRFGDLG